MNGSQREVCVSGSESKVRHVMCRLPSVAAVLLMVGCYAHDAGAQPGERAWRQRERARVAQDIATAEPRTATPARGDWYGWQTLIADATSVMLFIAGGAEGSWRRRALAGGVLGYTTATPIIHLAHHRLPQALVSALGRVIGSGMAHGVCTGIDFKFGPRDPSKGFYRSLDDQLGPDFGVPTVCAGLVIATMITLDAAAFAYEPSPSAQPKQRPPSLRQPPARDAPRIVPKIMLDERGLPMAGLLVLGEF